MALQGFKGQRKPKLQRTRYQSDGATSFTAEELFKIYERAKQSEGVSEGTLNNKRGAVQIFHKFCEVKDYDSHPSIVSTDTCREFINYLRTEYVKFTNNRCVKDEYKKVGLSAQTINTHLRHLRAMYNFLVDEQYIEANPFNKVKQVKEPVDTVDALTRDEIAKLLRVPNKRSFAGFRDYILTVLLLDTGLRITEAISLTRNNIDFTSKTILIAASISKNSKARYVPFSDKTSRLLRELYSELADLDTDYFFVTVFGNQLDKDVFRNRVKSYAKDAGIDRNVTVHMFRHTFAKYYLLNDGDVMTLQKILGHSSLYMVRRYVQMDTGDLTSQHTRHSPLNDIKI